MGFRSLRLGNVEIVRAAKGNAMYTVTRKNSQTEIMALTTSMALTEGMKLTASMERTAGVDFTVSMKLTVSMERTAGVDSTVSMNLMVGVVLTDVAVAESMRARGIAEKEKEDRFRSILMPREPRGCMLGCGNAGTTCIIGRGHMSARNAC